MTLYGPLKNLRHCSRRLTIGSLLIPSLILAAAALIVRRATIPESPLSFKGTFVQFAYMFIPVGLSMHLAHNISHLFKEGPGIVPAIQRTLNEYAGMNLGEPDWNVPPLMGDEVIFWLQMVMFIVLNIFSLYAGYRIAVRYYKEKALKDFIFMASRQNVDGQIAVSLVFMRPGKHRVFAEFRHNGAVRVFDHEVEALKEPPVREHGIFYKNENPYD